MELDEIANRIRNISQLERLEQQPAAPYDPAEAMENLEEAKNYIRFLYAQLMEQKEAYRRVLSALDEIKEDQKETRKLAKAQSDRIAKLLEAIAALTGDLKDANTKIVELTRTNETLNARLNIANKERYGTSKSQKGIKSKPQPKGKNDGRDDFDGTNSAAQEEPEQQDGTENQENRAVENEPEKAERTNRQGKRYNKQVVGTPIKHECDTSKLPEGTVIIKEMKPKIVRDIVCHIREHHFQRLKVRYPDGKEDIVYLPASKEEEKIYNEIVPGTSVTSNLLAHLLFDRYQMATPVYREAKNRLASMNWNTCRQNLHNWADKGAIHLNKLIPALKSAALHKGADVNVDETWCRYQTRFGHRKTYMWCLANRKAGIVIFFYEDAVDGNGNQKHGGRSRSVLKDFLGDAKIRSLQSDGYNVYMYLDGELMDVEHLCCLAHARAKFKYAYDQGCEAARFFLEQIGLLYKREEQYRSKGYTASKIKLKRTDAYTEGVIKSMECRMLEMIAQGETEVTDLMWRELKYLQTFWKNLFAYRNNGDYTIDNLVAERAIRPMTVQRKNSLFYCSVKGATSAAIYNTFIETCKQVGIPFQEYFKKVIQAFKSGREDYENLLPMTIKLT